jgi:plastocyanin
MLNLAAKVFAALATVALIAAVGYGVVVGDRAGADLLAILGGGFAVAATVVALAVTNDTPKPVAADAPAPERRNAYTAGDAPAGSAWPFVAGVVAAAIALGVAAGASWLAVAIAAAVIPTTGWLAQTWRAHPSFSPPVRERVVERLLAPIAMPVLCTLGALFIAAMISRVLLAVSTTASWVTALVLAAGLLAALWYVSTRPRLQPSALVGLGVVGVLAMTAAGAIGARAGEREFHPHEPEHPVAHLDAENTQFSLDKLTFPARETVEIKLRNRDAELHNVAFYTSTEPGAKPIWAGAPAVAHGRKHYETTTPDAGTYAFVCDFHPTMTGELVITEGAVEDHSEHADEEH